jgi:hypothetical protein
MHLEYACSKRLKGMRYFFKVRPNCFKYCNGGRDYRTLWPGTTKQASGQLGDVDRDPPRLVPC